MTIGRVPGGVLPASLTLPAPTDEQASAITRAVGHLTRTHVGASAARQRLVGEAGTGKTAAIGHVARALEARGFAAVDPDGGGAVQGARLFAIATPTNRSARILARRSGLPVATFHKHFLAPRVVYDPPHGPALAERVARLEEQRHTTGDASSLAALDDELMRLHVELRPLSRLVFDSRKTAALLDALICDEASMLGTSLFRGMPRDLRVLGVGDTGQLPPVKDTPAWASWPDLAHLQRVHRHGGALHDFVRALRRGERPETLRHMDTGPGGPLRIAASPAYAPGGHLPVRAMLERADIVIAHRNATRMAFNRAARRILYGVDTREDPIPRPGERLIVRSSGTHFANGDFVRLEAIRGDVRGRDPVAAVLRLLDDDMTPYGAPRTVSVGRSLLWAYGAAGPWHDQPDDVTLDFAYAITAHAAQGGQFGRVIVMGDDLSFAVQGADRARWFYTAASRATERLFFWTAP